MSVSVLIYHCHKLQILFKGIPFKSANCKGYVPEKEKPPDLENSKPNQKFEEPL
jgi:hypothetical protein